MKDLKDHISEQLNVNEGLTIDNFANGMDKIKTICSKLDAKREKLFNADEANFEKQKTYFENVKKAKETLWQIKNRINLLAGFLALAEYQMTKGEVKNFDDELLDYQTTIDGYIKELEGMDTPASYMKILAEYKDMYNTIMEKAKEINPSK